MRPADTLPVLYTFRRCPYAMRARLALVVSETAVEIREVQLRDKPPELLAVSPQATVPVLVLPDGQVMAQSLDIMRWALARHDPQSWLRPERSDLSASLKLVEANDTHFKHNLDRYKYPHRYPEALAKGPQAWATTHRDLGAHWLAGLESHLTDGWLCGGQASLADMALLPFVRQFAHTDAAWFAAQPWPRLQAWLAQFESSPLFQRIRDKHPVWRANPPTCQQQPP